MLSYHRSYRVGAILLIACFHQSQVAARAEAKAEAGAAAAAAAAAAVQEEGRRMRILLAQQEDIAAAAAGSRLARLGAENRTLRTGFMRLAVRAWGATAANEKATAATKNIAERHHIIAGANDGNCADAKGVMVTLKAVHDAQRALQGQKAALLSNP